MSAEGRLWKPLGELLVEAGVLDDEQLRIGLAEQGASHRPLGEVLVGLGFVSTAELRTALLEQCGLDMSAQTGFGSGLREQLERRSAQPAPAAVAAAPPLPPIEFEPIEAPVRELEIVDDPNGGLEATLAELERRAYSVEEGLAQMQRLLAELVA